MSRLQQNIFTLKHLSYTWKNTHWRQTLWMWCTDVCNKRFSHPRSLVTKESAHTGHKLYECDICKKRFSCSNNLTKHKRTHTRNELYECDICKKTFLQSGHLAKHKKTHAGDKPYECHVYNKRFSESLKLTWHKISAHKVKQSFECLKCMKTFTLRRNLKHHWRVHSRDGLLFCNSYGK
jgi:KRAB domain-containing zinc finger protein